MNDTIKSTVDEWLGEIENFSLRAERLPEGNVAEWMPWLYAAAKIGWNARQQKLDEDNWHARCDNER